MCVNCMSSLDAAVWSSFALAGMGASTIGRVVDQVTGGSPMVRRRNAYARNAEFVRSIGLEPVEVLGLPPA